MTVSARRRRQVAETATVAVFFGLGAASIISGNRAVTTIWIGLFTGSVLWGIWHADPQPASRSRKPRLVPIPDRVSGACNAIPPAYAEVPTRCLEPPHGKTRHLGRLPGGGVYRWDPYPADAPTRR